MLADDDSLGEPRNSKLFVIADSIESINPGIRLGSVVQFHDRWIIRGNGNSYCNFSPVHRETIFLREGDVYYCVC